MIVFGYRVYYIQVFIYLSLPTVGLICSRLHCRNKNSNMIKDVCESAYYLLYQNLLLKRNINKQCCEYIHYDSPIESC